MPHRKKENFPRDYSHPNFEEPSLRMLAVKIVFTVVIIIHSCKKRDEYILLFVRTNTVEKWVKCTCQVIVLGSAVLNIADHQRRNYC
jgi:uncharacterized membrane protein